MKHIIYIIAAVLILIVSSQSASTTAFSLRRKKTKTEQADTVRKSADIKPERYTDSVAFTARTHESMLRLVDNLRAISSPRNDRAIRAYLRRQTIGLFDLRADSLRPVKIVSGIDSSATARLMCAADFLAYLELQTDSVPGILALEVPAFAPGGYELGAFSECRSTLLRDSAGNLIPAGDGELALRCYWEPTVYGYEPAPQFGGMVLRMNRMQQDSVTVKNDTVEGRQLPVFIPVL